MGDKLVLDLWVLKHNEQWCGRDHYYMSGYDERYFPGLDGYGGRNYETPMTFAGKEHAERWIMANRYDHHYAAVPLPAGLWQMREMVRLGRHTTYTTDAYDHLTILPVLTPHEELPWHRPKWERLYDRGGEVRDILRKHVPYRSETDPTKIAFTEDDTKGAADRQTVTKPGRFLTKFFSDWLTPEDIAAMANEFVAMAEPGTLKFAKTADEIEHVYVNGPRSCMAHEAGKYDSPFHPVRVYEGPDLAVAYIERGGDITARALCWPEKKRYGRVYGDDHRLTSLLAAEGYERKILSGARFGRHEDSNGNIICPFIDDVGSVSDDGEYLSIEGELSASNTNGYLDRGYYCEDCHEYHDSTTDADGRAVCDRCLGDNYVWSDRFDRYISTYSAIEVRTGKSRWGWDTSWYEDGYDGDVYHCDATDAYYDASYIPCHDMANGEVWNEYYFNDNGFECALTGEKYPNDEGVDHPEHGMIHKDTDEAKALEADALPEAA